MNKKNADPDPTNIPVLTELVSAPKTGQKKTVSARVATVETKKPAAGAPLDRVKVEKLIAQKLQQRIKPLAKEIAAEIAAELEAEQKSDPNHK